MVEIGDYRYDRKAAGEDADDINEVWQASRSNTTSLVLKSQDEGNGGISVLIDGVEGRRMVRREIGITCWALWNNEGYWGLSAGAHHQV